MSISLKKSEIPLWLRESQFYEGLDDEDDYVTINEKQFKENTNVLNLKDFKKLVRTVDFWGVKQNKYIKSIYEFIDSSNANYYYILAYLNDNPKIGEKYAEELIDILKKHVESPFFEMYLTFIYDEDQDEDSFSETLVIYLKFRSIKLASEFPGIPIKNFKRNMFEGLKFMADVLRNKINIQKYLEYRKLRPESIDKSLKGIDKINALEIRDKNFKKLKEEFILQNNLDSEISEQYFFHANQIQTEFLNLPEDVAEEYNDNINNFIEERDQPNGSSDVLDINHFKIFYNYNSDKFGFSISGSIIYLEFKNQKEKNSVADEFERIYYSVPI